MTQSRWLALCGAVAALLIPAGLVVVSGNTPNDKTSADRVVSYYRGHLTANKVSALMVTIAAVLLALFAARLYEVLRGNRTGTAVFPLAAFGGALITSAGLLLAAVVHFALVQASDHQFAAVAQTLNVLDGNDFFAIVGGFAALLLPAGIATVMRPVLPLWMGWAAIVAAILCLAGPIGIAGLLLGLIWILVASILIIIRHEPTGAVEPAGAVTPNQDSAALHSHRLT